MNKSALVSYESVTGSDGNGPAADEGSMSILQIYCRVFLSAKSYRVTARGSVEAPFAIGASTQIDFQQLVDEFVTWMDSQNFDLKDRLAKLTLRMVLRGERTIARAKLINNLFHPLTSLQQRDAETGFRMLAENVFLGDSAIVQAVLGHFIWQSKRHMIGEIVTDHMMPILFGREQGSGKSTTARKLLEPLAELATEMSFATILDDRSRVNTYATLVDETEPVSNRTQVATLKRRVSGTTRDSRELFSHTMSTVVMHSAYIGTSNETVADTIDDPSGHRRFFDLAHRNGNTASGGDPVVWETVNRVDFLSLWRLIDASKPSPIKAVLSLLGSQSAGLEPYVSIREFLRHLNFEDEAVKSIVTEKDWIGASDLYELVSERTRTNISQKAFAQEMYRLIKRGEVPFSFRVRDRKGRWYPINRAFN